MSDNKSTPKKRFGSILDFVTLSKKPKLNSNSQNSNSFDEDNVSNKPKKITSAHRKFNFTSFQKFSLIPFLLFLQLKAPTLSTSQVPSSNNIISKLNQIPTVISSNSNHNQKNAASSSKTINLVSYSESQGTQTDQQTLLIDDISTTKFDPNQRMSGMNATTLQTGLSSKTIPETGEQMLAPSPTTPNSNITKSNFGFANNNFDNSNNAGNTLTPNPPSLYGLQEKLKQMNSTATPAPPSKPQNKNQNSSIEKELNVRWYWKSDTDWVEYPKNIAENLERAYMANQKTIQIDSERFVDLGVLQQKRIDNPIKIRPVKRVTIFPIQDTPKAAQPLIPNVISPKSNQPQQPLSIKPSNQNNLITQSKAQLQSSTTTIHSSAQQPKQFSQNTKQTEKEISLSSKPSTHKPIYAKWFWKGKKKTNPLVSFKLRI